MFYEKTAKKNLNSEQRIIYAEKRVNNFLNNAEQKIIFYEILEIVYVEISEQYIMSYLSQNPSYKQF